jgi:ketosteroid isomerase-like protein
MDLAEQIRAQRAASNAALAARDPDRVVSVMDASIAVGVAGGAVLRGLDANRAAWAEQMRDPDYLGYLRTPEHVLDGADQRSAAERGRWVGR